MYFVYIIYTKYIKSVFWKKHSTNAGYPLRVLGYFDRFWNGKCYNSPLVKCIGLKVRTFYIRGSCGGAWVDLEFYKIARFQDLEKSKMGLRPASLGWEGEKVDFRKFEIWVGGIRMPRIDPSRGVSMDAAREVKWDLRRNSCMQKKLKNLNFFI